MYRSTIAIAVLATSASSLFAQELTATGQIAPVNQERNPAPEDRAPAVGTAFTYQGYLEVSGAPADGVYDLRFTLYDGDGVVVSGPICRDNVRVSDGQFTVSLDFGSQYTGLALYLEIGVRAGGAVGDCAIGLYTTLSPRQPLTPAPYAMGLRLPYTGELTLEGGSPVTVTNPGSLSGTTGMRGITYGASTFGFSDRAGVRGESNHPTGAGLLGISDLYVGVLGYSYGDDGIGTFGRATDAEGIGVWGWATDTEGIGVKGSADDTLTGWGGYFEGRGYFSNRVGIGTQTPTQMLDVNGYVKTNGYQMLPGAAPGKVLTSDASGFGTWQTVPGTIAYVGSDGGSANAPSATLQFLSPTMTVTISAGQKIVVNVDRAFGSTAVGGANLLNLYPAHRNTAGSTITVIDGGIFGLTAAQNERKTFGINGVISGLPAGTYEVGMAGQSGSANWNNNEWGYITVMVIN